MCLRFTALTQVVKHHGSTDQLIGIDVMRYHGMEESVINARLPAFCKAMIDYSNSHADSAACGIEILPGVEAVLTALAARDDVIVCLVTGNLEPIAWHKMAALRLSHLFTPPCFGGFGSDHTERTELVLYLRPLFRYSYSYQLD